MGGASLVAGPVGVCVSADWLEAARGEFCGGSSAFSQ